MNTSSSLHNHIHPWRITVFVLLVILILLIYVGRLFTLQILQGPQWLAQADDNRTEIVNIPAARGVVYDRNGTVVARNIASYNVVLNQSAKVAPRRAFAPATVVGIDWIDGERAV